MLNQNHNNFVSMKYMKLPFKDNVDSWKDMNFTKRDERKLNIV